MTMITVLGAGAWGTAVATLLAANNHNVTLWCYNQEVAKSIHETRNNSRCLPNFELSEKITPTTDLRVALASEIIFEAIPVQFLRSVLEQCKPHRKNNQLWVGLSKGIEHKTLLVPTQMITDILGDDVTCAALSGPSYAHDLAEQQPTGVTIAADDAQVVEQLKELLTNDYFCVEKSDDLLGIQMGGALKNIFALGIGVLAGAGYQSNTQALMMMRGLQEFEKLLTKLGCNKETLYSSAGIGDLVLTSFGGKSRNYNVGFLLGQGKKLDVILKETGQTCEGANTLKSIKQLAERNNIELPICTQLYKITFENTPVKHFAKTLCT